MTESTQIPVEFIEANELYDSMLEKFKEATDYYTALKKELDEQFHKVREIGRKYDIICINKKFYTKEEAQKRFMPKLGLMMSEDGVLEQIQNSG